MTIIEVVNACFLTVGLGGLWLFILAFAKLYHRVEQISRKLGLEDEAQESVEDDANHVAP